ncbi:hypothetical protein [Geothrix fuzhouensis]|uniref:hypothetical protein n=1 Tax=Geothrix fuzhouensis TaxID=2966451 RepID=UPI00214983CB|nr:hypothetical protein [Geothrix fuzhouensis]
MPTNQRSLIFRNQTVRLTILCVSFALSFRSFQFFPGMGLVQEAWFVLAALALATVYLRWKLPQGLHPSRFEAYVFTIMVIMPFWSAYVAQQEFGQPLIYGLLAQRGMVLIAAVPLLTLQALATRTISLKDIERVLIILAWATLVLYLGMALFLEPGSYFNTYGIGFVTGPEKEAVFKFDVVFIVFGFYYYAFKGVRRNSLISYLQSGIFLLFLLLIINGRSLLLSLIAAFLWFAVLWAPNKARLLAFLPKVALAISLIWIGLYLLNHDLYIALVDKFSNAFTVLFTGELTDDPSANARIHETVLAYPYMIKHWTMGNGMVSTQWNGGFETAMSGYFHPSDIGILGVIFLYGILGVILYLGEFWFAISSCKRTNPTATQYRTLHDSTKGLILFYGIRSLATAHFVHYAEVILFFVGLLIYIQKNHPLASKEKSPTLKVASY